MTRREAEKAIKNVALDTNFAVPGDAGFPLNQQFEGARDRHEAETLRLRTRDPREALATLFDLGRRHVFLEGGPTLAAAFLSGSFEGLVLTNPC